MVEQNEGETNTQEASSKVVKRIALTKKAIPNEIRVEHPLILLSDSDC